MPDRCPRQIKAVQRTKAIKQAVIGMEKNEANLCVVALSARLFRLNNVVRPSFCLPRKFNFGYDGPDRRRRTEECTDSNVA